MKETSVIFPVFRCSECSYKSLQKPPVEKHIKAKCSGATLIKEKKLVKHRDLSQGDDDVATLYQCSNCEYTSQQSTHVKTHIASKCQGAEVLSEKRKLTFEDVPKVLSTSSTVSQQGVLNNTGNVGTINQININLVVQANSEEEFALRIKAAIPAIREMREALGPDASINFLPSTILKGLEQANPALDNKVLKNNSIVCLKTKEKTPLVKYSKIELVNLYNMMLKILENNDQTDDEGNEISDDVYKMIIDLCINPYNQDKIIKCLKDTPEDELFTKIRDQISKDIKNDPHRKSTQYTDQYILAVRALEEPLSKIEYHNQDKTRKPTKMKKPNYAAVIVTKDPDKMYPPQQTNYYKYQNNIKAFNEKIKITKELIRDITEYYKTHKLTSLNK